MKVVMTPNPYRDKQFRVAEQAQSILEAEGVTVRMCLPFEVDKSYPLPSGIHFYDLKKEIRDAQMLICFGGDGTILHASKFATANHIPVLGVNIGTMGCSTSRSRTAHSSCFMRPRSTTRSSPRAPSRG